MQFALPGSLSSSVGVPPPPLLELLLLEPPGSIGISTPPLPLPLPPLLNPLLEPLPLEPLPLEPLPLEPLPLELLPLELLELELEVEPPVPPDGISDPIGSAKMLSPGAIPPPSITVERSAMVSAPVPESESRA